MCCKPSPVRHPLPPPAWLRKKCQPRAPTRLDLPAPPPLLPILTLHHQTFRHSPLFCDLRTHSPGPNGSMGLQGPPTLSSPSGAPLIRFQVPFLPSSLVLAPLHEVLHAKCVRGLVQRHPVWQLHPRRQVPAPSLKAQTCYNLCSAHRSAARGIASPPPLLLRLAPSLPLPHLFLIYPPSRWSFRRPPE